VSVGLSLSVRVRFGCEGENEEGCEFEGEGEGECEGECDTHSLSGGDSGQAGATPGRRGGSRPQTLTVQP